MNYLYQHDDVGLTLLSDRELEGGYPLWFSDQEVHKFNSHWSRPQSEKNIKEFVNSLAHDKSKLVFSVYSIKDQVHIGNVSLQAIDHLNQCAEMAFMFGDRKYWGKGYASKASKLIIQHGFKYLNFNRLYLGCLNTNLAMCKLANSLGFTQEGVRRKAIYSNGEFCDVVDFGLLKDEIN